jgi:hypothetical protein
MKSRRELAEQQLELMNDIRAKANINIVTCGNCGTVLLHSMLDDSIVCYSNECKDRGEMDLSDCPDLWYEGCIENMIFDDEPIKEEPTITFADIIQVAERLSLDVTIYEIKEVFNRYNQISENNEDNFSVIIEDLLYNIISERVV